MKVLLAHNYYQQPGGEDVVFAAERDLLRSRGHEVIEFVDHNSRIRHKPAARLVAVTAWSRSAHRALSRLLIRHRPDVAHFHNTFPLISPAAYYACRDAGVPVVQTLHNYRLLCPAATLYRGGKVCELCLGRRWPWPAVQHACYRSSRAASATVAAMLATHRLAGTWAHAVTLYLALSEFARGKFVSGGLPPERIMVKPNFIEPAPTPGAHDGGYALFVGRLVPEKGVRTLVAAWRSLADMRLPLKIVGDGPLAQLQRGSPPDVEWLGAQPRQCVLALMQHATMLIVPSEWYEGGVPLTLLEGFATGLPVIASRLGALADPLVSEGGGISFTPGDSEDLAAKVRSAAANPSQLRARGRKARNVFEAEYTAERNYQLLVQAYGRSVAASVHGRRSSGRGG